MSADTGLLEIALPLRPRRAGPAPPGLGTTGHGLLFSLLAQADPDLANELHRPSNERRPFTVSPLLERVGRGPIAQLDPTRCCWLRFTFLTHTWVACWGELLAPALQQAPLLHLGPDQAPHFDGQICPWDFTYDAHGPPPWRRAARYADLLAFPPSPRWRLRFLTPTAFQAAAAPAARPVAHPTFTAHLGAAELLRSLAAAWSRLAPEPLRPAAAPERVAELASQVRFVRPRLQRRPGILGRPGFVGEVDLLCDPGLTRPADASLRLLGALLRFATFAGAGVQTARGMGIVWAEPLAREE